MLAAGAPGQAITDTLAEYNRRSRATARSSNTAPRGLWSALKSPARRPSNVRAAMRTLELSGNPEVTKPTREDRWKSFMGSAPMVLTIRDSGIARYAYYSKDLFEASGGKILPLVGQRIILFGAVSCQTSPE